MVRIFLPILAAYIFLGFGFLIPVSTNVVPPFFDLSSPYMDLVYVISQSGKYGLTLIVLLVLIILLRREGQSSKHKINEVLVIAVVALILGGAGAVINERVVKTHFEVPRPNIVWLAGEDGKGPLGMPADDFYAVGDKEIRRQVLSTVLENSELIPLSSSIKRHWIYETGYSFPSGHSFSAMFFAIFLFLICSSLIKVKNVRWIYVLFPWGVAVCFSRPMLGVHTPTDVFVGAVQGGLLGCFAWVISIKLIRQINSM